MEIQSKTKQTRNPPWAWDELILALDLYFDLDSSKFTSTNPKIVELSEILNKLNIHSERPDETRFRKPNGVSMKLSNFLRLDPAYHGSGLERGGKLEELIWEKFAKDRKLLRHTAEEIRASVL